MNIEHKEISSIIEALEQYLQNKTKPIILTLVAIFSEGHLLIEDLPGIGKTTLALAIAKVLGLSFGRIQCTPDLLPSDITGINIYKKETEQFEFQRGPIFNNIILIDEINRTTQKTQSALLEAMEEMQVTVDGKSYNLPYPFFVIATQNPTEHYGTFPLPDSQMDRFLMNITIGYPDHENEILILKFGNARNRINSISPVLSAKKIEQTIKEIKEIRVSEKILDYIVKIITETRDSKFLSIGVSPRGSLALLNSAKTLAYFHNRNYIIPDDIIFLAPHILSHRIVPKDEYLSFNKKELIENIVKSVPLPYESN